MSTKDPQSIISYLTTDDQDLKYVLNKARQLEKINEKVTTLLEPKIALQCRVANIKDNKLVMIVANGAIATQLRYQSVDLIQKFKQINELKQIDTILYKVSHHFLPRREQKVNPADKMSFLSQETSNAIMNMAETIEDPRLKEVMKRIAKHVVGDKD